MSDAAKPTPKTNAKPLPAKNNGGLRAKQHLLETPATFPRVPALSTIPSEVLQAEINKAKKPVLAIKTADPLVGRPNAQGHKPHTAALNPHLSSHPNRKLGRKQ